ncbi:hypothetical protein IWQ54_003427 [Labrenzia sp. EL_195]|nr:hypothetical protein [Labrenzia sp. EL_195]
MRTGVGTLSLLALLALSGGALAQDTSTFLDRAPVASSGHGFLFDRSGAQIDLDQARVEEIVEAYLQAYQASVTDDRRESVVDVRTILRDQTTVSDRELLLLKLEYLKSVVSDVDSSGSTAGIIKFLISTTKSDSTRGVYSRALSESTNLRNLRESIKILDAEDTDPIVEEREKYIQECRDAGVPIPPDLNSASWVRSVHGGTSVLTDAQEFIAVGLEAEVFVYESNSPAGMCIALPRSDGDTTVLDGVICLGQETSNTCFWDNQKNDVTVPFAKGEIVPIIEFAGGPELFEGEGGVCTSCHAGENPYVIHPNTPLGRPALGAYPTFSEKWYTPLVHPNWPQNPESTSAIPTGPCSSCHSEGGPGGRFPELSSDLVGYCSTILPLAIQRTMPPFNPGDPAYKDHADALLALCER